MTDTKWYWQDVPFIPNKINKSDMLRFQGHIFIKSNVVKQMKTMGTFKIKKKRTSAKDRRRKGITAD